MLSCSLPMRFSFVMDISHPFHLGISYDWDMALNGAFDLRQKLSLFGVDRIELQPEATPGWFNNGFQNYPDGQEELAFLHKKAKISEKARSLSDQSGLMTERAILSQSIEIINKANEPLVKHPAILSGRLEMIRLPTDSEIEIILSQTHNSLAHQEVHLKEWRLVQHVSSVLKKGES